MALVLVALGVLFYRDRTEDDSLPPRPTSEAGSAESIDVLEALRAEGLNAEFGQGRGIPRGVLAEPGQLFVVEGVPLYAFIYTSVAEREEDTANVDPERLLAEAPTPATATAAPPAEARVAAHSNVLVLFAGDDDLAARVTRAIEGIP